ncbi:MAG: HAD-IA family hydrolase [Acidimicrobiales bacterium]
MTAARALIRGEFALGATHAEVVEAVRTIPTGLLPGADVLVAEVRRLVPVGVLSNTNALHWSSQPDADAIQAMVDHAFVSFRIGLVKPDRDIFDHVASDLAVDPASVVFLDDNEVNVDGARRAGFEAHLAIGPVQARSVLIDLGLLGTGVATP